MFQFETTLFRFVREYAHRLTRDISDDKFRHQVNPATNTPQWIIGHLVLGHEFALKKLGESGNTPPTWFKWFGPGSSVDQIPPEGPGKEELMNAFDMTHAQVLAALQNADEASMKQKHDLPIEFLQQLTPTVGELIAHLLTTHPASHLGQLSFWRRAMGLSGVLV